MYFSDTVTSLLLSSSSEPRYYLHVPRASASRLPSAAQNETVVKTCTQCGAVNDAEAATCCFCDTRLSQNTRQKSAPPPPRPKSPQTEGNLAIATDWRNEVSSRLEAYRGRHKRTGPDPTQPEFSFGDHEPETPEPETAARVHAAPSTGVDSPTKRLLAPSADVNVPSTRSPAPTTPPARPRQNKSPWLDQMNRLDQVAQPDRIERGNRADKLERPSRADQIEQSLHADKITSPGEFDRMDIDVTHPALDFDASTFGSSSQRKAAEPSSSWSESAPVPVASLPQRRRAALLDAALLLFSYGGFLSLFAALGGRFAFSKPDLAVVAATVALFYALYVALFTFFGGSTPGMMLTHLRVVSFDASDPTPGQLLWRSFGYLVSAGMLLFGFLAAIWDEDNLTWHDRISQTYLTTSDEISAAAPPVHPAREDYRHRG